MGKKAQSAIEFIIIIGVMMTIFLIFTFIFQSNLTEKTKAQRGLMVQDIASNVQDEIELAYASTDGYFRQFEIQEKIINIDYTIQLVDEVVYIYTADNQHALALPVKNVTGQVQKGQNTITKQEGIVCVNIAVEECLPGAMFSPGECGNGEIEDDEQCDDGDENNNDGCDEDCDIEFGWMCVNEPSECYSLGECNDREDNDDDSLCDFDGVCESGQGAPDPQCSNYDDNRESN